MEIERIKERWKPLLDAGVMPVKNEKIREQLSILLENTLQKLEESDNIGNRQMQMSIVSLRKIYPQLLLHNFINVDPINIYSEENNEKVPVHKLGANWSLELEEDMLNMHGVDVVSELADILSYEIHSELDRRVVSKMVKVALNNKAYSEDDSFEEDETLDTMLNSIVERAEGMKADFIVISKSARDLFELNKDFIPIEIEDESFITSNVSLDLFGEINGIDLYCDTFAGGNYVLIGNSEKSPLTYRPYIPIITGRHKSDDFTPRMGISSQYDIDFDDKVNLDEALHFIKLKSVDDMLKVQPKQGEVSSNHLWSSFAGEAYVANSEDSTENSWTVTEILTLTDKYNVKLPYKLIQELNKS